MNKELEETVRLTNEHIALVKIFLNFVRDNLLISGIVHDSTKLIEPELSVFNEFTPKLKASTYGGQEYKEFLAEMKPALDHHYASNSHHPEHFENGIRGMNLVDLVEMFCDWAAAAKRHDDGDLEKSIDIGQGRFLFDDDLLCIFRNTAKLFEEASGI